MRPLLALPAAALLGACAIDVTVAPTTELEGGADSTFTWSRQLAPGARLAVVDGNGSIEVREGGGDRVELVAVTTVLDRGRAASKVAIGIEEAVAGVTVCTLYDAARRCADPMRAVNVRTRFAVLVPRGVRLVLTTGNGGITVADGGADVVATTGNGDIELRRGADGAGDATLTTGNGAITATLPAAFRGRVDATTGNGVVRSEFPVVTSGVADARHLSGTIGAGGGAHLRMTTGNGSVTLRRSSS